MKKRETELNGVKIACKCEWELTSIVVLELLHLKLLLLY